MSYESSSFPRILALLRKEKGISQKIAAGDLAVSQALLSHYEKGIRKPSLDFLVRCADYYEISCDYLLGRTADRQGTIINVEDIPNPEDAGKVNQGVGGILPQLNKKLIANSQNIIFDMLTKIGNKSLTSEVSAYLMLAVYRMFRIIFSSNPKNETDMFELPAHVYSQYTDATMQIIETKANAIAIGKPIGKEEKIKAPGELIITTETLNHDYPLFVSSLLNLVQTAEKRIGFKNGNKTR